MQRCTNELYWMDQQAEERIKYDWSDNNLDYPARQRQYEVTVELAHVHGERNKLSSLSKSVSTNRISSVSVWSPRRAPSPS